MNNKFFFIIALLFSVFQSLVGQYGSQTEPIDSLKTRLQTSEGIEAIEILNQIAFYTTLSFPKEAEEYAEQALAFAKRLDYYKGQADASQRLGILKYRQGFTNQSIDHLIHADSIYQLIGETSLLCTNYRCLGNAYLGYHDFQTVLHYYHKALDCCDSLAEPITFATNLMAIGSTLRKTDSPNKAIGYILRAKKIFYLLNYEFGIAGVHSSIGDIDLESGQYSEAMDSYLLALPYYEKIQDKTTIGHIKTRIATVFLSLDSLSQARKHAFEGLEYSTETNSKPNILEALRLIYLSFQREGNIELALKYHEKYFQVFEDITEERHQKNISLLQSERLRAEINTENILLKKEQEAQAEKNRSRTIGGIAVLSLALTFILLLLVVNRQRKVALALSKAHGRQLEEQAELLVDSNITKNTLLDILSHDLKNPASSILGLSEVLLEETQDSKYLRGMNTAADKLIQVIQQTSTLAELQQGNPIEKEELNLYDLVARAFKQNEEGLELHSIDTELNIPDNLIIYANPIIESIFRNFIQNAVKYAHAGKLITAGVAENHGGLKILISDRGTTIPKERQEQIFRRSVQLGPKGNSGSGLGLAISKQIAEAHHAEIGLEPNLPKGNSFYIILPQKARFIS